MKHPERAGLEQAVHGLPARTDRKTLRIAAQAAELDAVAELKERNRDPARQVGHRDELVGAGVQSARATEHQVYGAGLLDAADVGKRSADDEPLVGLSVDLAYAERGTEVRGQRATAEHAGHARLECLGLER